MQIELADATAVSGLEFTYRNGREADRYTILESLGGGVGLVDFDGDGRLDVWLTGGGRFPPTGPPEGLPSELFRNLGGARFERIGHRAGIERPRGYTHGVAAADFDQDGFGDVLITGFGALQLWQNQGDGTFQDVTIDAGLQDASWSTGAGWGDFDGDGLPDLYVARYVDWSPNKDPRCPPQYSRRREICSPLQFRGLADGPFLSRGDGTFQDASTMFAPVEPGKGLGVLVADLDLDGRCDIYVANDTTPNFLFLRDAAGRWTESACSQGVALDEMGVATGSMGVDAGDFDEDGRPDIAVANYDSELFGMYRRSGSVFTHATAPSGLAAIGTTFVGWGTAFTDLDRDGDEDLVISNGHVLYHPENSTDRQRPLVLLNLGGRFREVEFPANHYLGQRHHGRGLAVGDLNDDGTADLIVSHNNEPVRLLLNRTPSSSQWVLLRLIGRHANRDAIGARVEWTCQGHPRMRLVKGSWSYLSQGDRRLLLALAPAGQATVKVHWPSGVVQVCDLAQANTVVTVVEATGP
ncbi:MAG: CRTAC1 family protein [Pirellulaceae bacterium]|nr:CRTAC1 family protein [Pirellulaceae bacterium]